MALTDEGLVRIPGMASRWVRLSDGSRAHYMTAGDEGPAVILLHGGIPGSSGTAGWRFMAPFLGSHGYRVYCPDQPAFGLSDNRPEYFPVHGVLSHVDFLERFAQALCLDEFFLAGNSMGCINAAHYAVRYPHRVTSFALIAGFIGTIAPYEITSAMQTPVQQNGDMRAMMQSIIKNGDAITDDLIDMRTLAAERNMEAWDVWHRNVIQGKGDPDVGIQNS